MKNKLFFFVVSTYAIIGLLKDDKFINFKKIEINNNLSEKIITSISKFINKNLIHWNEIDLVYSNIEPGRHTNTRITTVFLRMIKVLNINIEIKIINTLRFLAFNEEVIVCTFVTKKLLDAAYFKDGKQIEFFNKISKEEIKNIINNKFNNLKIISDYSDFDFKERFLKLENYFKVIEFKDIKNTKI